jgi:beta-ribofuranosylaminobenzene 5'-phosphate synthase
MLQRADRVFVDAPARLHFGVLDLRGSLGRWFGGIGAAAPGPSLLLSAAPADTLTVSGEDGERAAAFARRFLDAYAIGTGADIVVQRGLPRHSGLGSGTQLALAVARALAEVHGVAADAAALARAVGRGRRSAVGTWTFAGGGFVLEGGRHREQDGPGPLLARIPFPAAWCGVVAVPSARSGVSGAHEEAAFATLPEPSETEVQEVSHLTLMGLLPAVVDGDLGTFGQVLTRIQEITGGWFAAVQGGMFAPGASTELVERMREWNTPGIGQSSWGPAVYGVVRSAEEGKRLADRLETAVERVGGGRVYHGRFPTEGARVRIESATPEFP